MARAPHDVRPRPSAPPLTEWLAILTVAALGGGIQGVLGFGFGLTAIALLPFWMPVREAVPLVALLALALNSSLIWQLRRALTPRNVAPLLAGSAIGVPIGVGLLVETPADLLLGGLGGVLLIYVSSHVWRRPFPRSTPPPWLAPIAGLVGGVLHGALNTGGPPVVAYAHLRRDWSPNVVRGVLASFFLLNGILQVGLISTAGLIHGHTLQGAGVGVLGAVVGGTIGVRIGQRANPQTFKHFLLGGLGVVGCSLVLRAMS